MTRKLHTLYFGGFLPLQALLLEVSLQAVDLTLILAGRLAPLVQVLGDRRQAAPDSGVLTVPLGGGCLQGLLEGPHLIPGTLQVAMTPGVVLFPLLL